MWIGVINNIDTDDEVDVGVLSRSDKVINNTDVNPTTSKANNNMDVKIDAGVLGMAIKKTK